MSLTLKQKQSEKRCTKGNNGGKLSLPSLEEGSVSGPGASGCWRQAPQTNIQFQEHPRQYKTFSMHRIGDSVRQLYA